VFWPVPEEPDSVEVGAPDLVGLDHLVGARLTQAQRPVDLAVLLGPLAVDHRPLVQAGTPGGRAVQPSRTEAP